MTLNKLEALVIDWAKERGLNKLEYNEKQYLKFLEEVGETCRAVLKQDKPAMIDGFGDIAVTMIVLNLQIRSISEFRTYDGHSTNWTFGDLVRRVQPDFINPMAMDCLDTLCYQQGYELVDCLNSAYNEIKNRQGKLVNGTFVKEVTND
jgi:hypothetical protein